MNARWVGLAVCLLLAVVLISLGSGCSPCASCSTTTGRHKPTPTASISPTPTSTPTPAPNACLPSSSLSVLVQGTNATAYLPQGSWDEGTASVKVVPIETSSGIGTGG